MLPDPIVGTYTDTCVSVRERAFARYYHPATTLFPPPSNSKFCMKPWTVLTITFRSMHRRWVNRGGPVSLEYHMNDIEGVVLNHCSERGQNYSAPPSNESTSHPEEVKHD